jgi:hypothetical protein
MTAPLHILRPAGLEHLLGADELDMVFEYIRLGEATVGVRATAR